MKKVISIILVLSVCTSLVALSGCSSLNLQEQPDAVVIYADKIYPNQVGDYLVDASVNVPAIEAYMRTYNKNADESAVINYDTIKYNKDAGYYYVNDKETNLGIKFRLDSTNAIATAAIYTGTLDQTEKNLYNIVINAIETSGYKQLMSDEDKAIIQHTIAGFNGVSESKNQVLQIFNGQENFAAKWDNEIAEFEIPIQPEAMPEPDRSHTLQQIEMPTIEIPSITLDTTIVEGTHLPDGTKVTGVDITTVANKITNASSNIASVNEYNKITPDSVNSIIDDIAVQGKINDVTQTLFDVDAYVKELQAGQETKDLSTTKDLTTQLNNSYADYEKLTKVDVGFTGANGVKNDFDKYIGTIFTKGELDTSGGMLFSDKNALNNVKNSINTTLNNNGIKSNGSYSEPALPNFKTTYNSKLSGSSKTKIENFISSNLSGLMSKLPGASSSVPYNW